MEISPQDQLRSAFATRLKEEIERNMLDEPYLFARRVAESIDRAILNNILGQELVEACVAVNRMELIRDDMLKLGIEPARFTQNVWEIYHNDMNFRFLKEDLDAIEELQTNGKKIPAIKMFREKAIQPTSPSLKEAKNAVECVPFCKRNII